jgi:hypothetical protein
MSTEDRARRRWSGGRPALLALTLAALAPLGCEHEEPPAFMKKAVKMVDLPENVQAAAKKALPEIKLNDAWKNLDSKGNLTSYEIRGRSSKGKIREVRISLTGEVLEME